MKAIIWIIVLAIIAWGIWWFVKRDDTAGIPATGDTSGQVEGASDSSVIPSDTPNSGEYDSKG